ncbi:helix-turn-helix domain-containing protein [Candidatus Parcubacteria bacterium]|nr:helix-turn-helix domain-containing protein [Candidatus Parcubacteria bacterium]
MDNLPTNNKLDNNSQEDENYYGMPKKLSPNPFLLTEIKEPLWLSISEASKLAGVNSKTIRRALQTEELKYTIVKNRYSIDFSSFILYILKHKKIRNKFLNYGIGQYIEKWVK